MIRECAIGDYRIYAGCGLALDGTRSSRSPGPSALSSSNASIEHGNTMKTAK